MDTAAKQLVDLAARFWDLFLAYNPTYATSLGYREHDHRLESRAPGPRALHYDRLRALSNDVAKLDAGHLSQQDKITHEALATTLEKELADEALHEEYWSINPVFGTHIWMAELASGQPTDTDETMDRLTARYQAIPQYLDTEIANLKLGLAQGQSAYEMAVNRSLAQLERILGVDRAEICFLSPNQEATQKLSEAALSRLNKAIDEDVLPAFKRYQTFLQEEYAPKARKTPGLSSMPGGAEFYNFAIEYYTGRARDPKVVHQTGLDEVARIQSQMREIALSVTGNDDLPTFVDYLAKLPEQHPESREAIVAFNQGLVEKAERELPKYFERLPGHKCTVTPIEKFREADSPAGYYDRAPEDHSQPAKYYVNAHNPTERLYYNMEALAFHEAVPGHHLQIALAQELTDLPDFRRHLGETAYTEGWALYTERLSDEMGLYSGPIGRFGMLNFQAWRAARLVIDTGLHAMGWTRGQSIDYLKEITGFDSQHAAIEIDRYIVMPGQALAYMLGRLEIDAMRKKAETTLGSAFNLKKFHSQILDQGALPLASVGRLLDTWLDEQTQSMSS